ncbi:MAG TPA: metal-dependent phosphohydrolase, partial [Planctomycetaceae bacterium]|nr:metal-dependent phosphohydrolase [Planctomycetaceae bacterium]
MNDFRLETLIHDPIHGYIPYTDRDPTAGSTTERDLIESKWMQRMRYIHQLQTAWWVYPSAEHTRFQHCV